MTDDRQGFVILDDEARWRGPKRPTGLVQLHLDGRPLYDNQGRKVLGRAEQQSGPFDGIKNWLYIIAALLLALVVLGIIAVVDLHSLANPSPY